MRYVFPGLAATLLTVVAAVFVDRHLLCWVNQSSVAELLAAVLGSGGVGFLLAQVYFACPSSRVNYSDWVNANLEQLRSVREFADYQRFADLKKLGRRQAWDVVHYLWEERVVASSRSLDRSASRLAARMSAIGATLLGVVVGALAWAAVAIHAFVSGHGSLFGLTIGTLLFAATFWALGRAHLYVSETIKRIVLLRLSQEFPGPKSNQPQRAAP
jgi:hypothetical protein